jgi:hypothetical protein
MTSTVLLFEFGTYTSARSPATAGLKAFSRSAAYTSVRGGAGAVVGSVAVGAVVAPVDDDGLDADESPEHAVIQSNEAATAAARFHRRVSTEETVRSRTLGFGCA